MEARIKYLPAFPDATCPGAAAFLLPSLPPPRPAFLSCPPGLLLGPPGSLPALRRPSSPPGPLPASQEAVLSARPTWVRDPILSSVLVSCMRVCIVPQSCPTICNPMNYSPPAPLSMGFPRQDKHWGELSFPPPGDLPNPGMELASPIFSALAGRFFTTVSPGKPPLYVNIDNQLCCYQHHVFEGHG